MFNFSKWADDEENTDTVLERVLPILFFFVVMGTAAQGRGQTDEGTSTTEKMPQEMSTEIQTFKPQNENKENQMETWYCALIIVDRRK